MARALRIVGVFAGFVVVALVVRLVAVQFVMHTAEREAEAIGASLQQSAERMNARLEAQREAERRRQEQSLRQQAEQAALAAERERLDAEAARRKEAAWNEYYTPAKACDRPETWEIQVECGNRYMRAKREFEAKWSEQESAATERALVIRGG